jgi:autotransporter-associated beta strand protein
MTTTHRRFWTVCASLALAINAGAALLSDNFSGAVGTPLVGSALDVGGVWSNTKTSGSGTMNSAFLFASGGGVVAQNDNGPSVYTTFNASTNSSNLTNGFTLSVTFAANGYSDFNFTLGLAEVIDKGHFINLVTGDVIRFTYYVGGTTAGTFKWAIYDGGAVLNNDTSTRTGTQTINSNDIIRLSMTCFPAAGLFTGAATNITGGYLLSSSRVVLNTPGLTNTLYAGMGMSSVTVASSTAPAKVTAFSATSESLISTKPLTWPAVPISMTFSSFGGETNLSQDIANHAPIDIIHGGSDSTFDTLRATYPQKILTKQDAWAGIAMDREDLTNAYPGHLLLKLGTLLASNCPSTTADTVLYVRDYTRIATDQPSIDALTNSIESYLLMYALTNGRPDWSRAEHVRMTAVNPNAGSITVRRSQLGSSALSFTNGLAVLARHVMFWSDPNGGQWQLNFSFQCPRGGPFNMTAAEWYALRKTQIIYLSGADGMEFDVAQWSHVPEDMLDCDNDLVADYGYINGINSFGLGGQVFLKRFRELLGPNKIIQMDGNAAMGQRGWQYVNGVQLESFPMANAFDRYSQAFLHLRLWVSNVLTAPAFSYPFTKTPTTLYGHVYDTDGSNVDWRFRVGFAAALLTGMPHPFNSITDINFDPENPGTNDVNLDVVRGLFQWDEYVGGTNDQNNWKWLGGPQSAALQITNNMGSSNLLAGTVWEWKTETNFLSSCTISNGEYAATISQIPSNTPPRFGGLYYGSQAPLTLWFGTRLQATSGMPAFQPDQEYTLEFEARGNDSWTNAAQVFDKVPRALVIHGIANHVVVPVSAFVDSNWRSYRMSIIADSSAPPPLMFGVSEQVGNVSLRNIRLYEGGAERWVREFTNGIVLLNMTKSLWSYTTPTVYRHFNGTQHPEINNGQRLPPTFVVPSWDALFLVKMPGTNIIVPAATALDFSNGLLLGTNDSLSGWGVVTGNVAAASGAMIYPGTLGTPTGTLSFSNSLTLNGQKLTFDLTSNPLNGNDRLVVAGTLTNNGTTTISLNYISGWLGAGTYTLITCGATVGGTFALDAAYPNVTLNVGSRSVSLTVSGSGSLGAPLTWHGDGAANLWDIGASANWMFNGQPVTFTDGAGARFDDTAANFTVNLNTNVSPASLICDAANSYTIAGTGGIRGAGGLIKTNTGQLTLATVNSYSGGTLVAAGTLSGDAASLQGNITNNASLVFSHANNGTFTGVISGPGTLTKADIGILTLNGLNTYTGDTIIANTATLQVSSDANLGVGTNITINQNGSLKTSANVTTSKRITFVGGSPALDIAAGTTLTANGPLTGTSTSPRKDTSTGTLTLNASNSFAPACVFLLQTGRLNLGHPAALNGATLKFNGTVTLDNTSAGGNAFTAPTGLAGVEMTSGFNCAGTASLDLSAAPADFVQTANSVRTITVTTNTLVLGGILTTGTDGAGTARVDGSLTKAGNGTLILSGVSDYTGKTTNSAGTLLVNGTLGAGAVVVKIGASFGGSGVLRGPLTVEPGTLLQPGAGGANIATLTVSNAATLSGTTLLPLNRTNAQKAGKLTVSGTLTLGGALIATNVGPALQAGDTFTLLSAATITGTFSSTNLPALTSGLSWNTSQLTANLTITVVGAPATNPPVFLPPSLSGTNLVLTGTNGTPGAQYLVLASTNVTLPRANWTVQATNTFGPGGQFAFTNTLSPAEPPRFLILRLR